MPVTQEQKRQFKDSLFARLSQAKDHDYYFSESDTFAGVDYPIYVWLCKSNPNVAGYCCNRRIHRLILSISWEIGFPHSIESFKEVFDNDIDCFKEIINRAKLKASYDPSTTSIDSASSLAEPGLPRLVLSSYSPQSTIADTQSVDVVLDSTDKIKHNC